MIGTDLSQIECHIPSTIEEAVQQKSEIQRLVPIAGGTEIMVLMNDGLLKDRQFQSLHRLAKDWRYIHVGGDKRLHIGALTTLTQVRFHPYIQKNYPLLVESTTVTGALQIQNRGTLAGNIVNGSPAADNVPALMSYEADLVLIGKKGTRTVKLTEFYTGYRKTILGSDELLAEIILPAPTINPAHQIYSKVGTRAAQAISKVVFAGIKSNGTVRLSWGSVAATTLRTYATEKAIASGATPEEAVQVLMKEIKPLDDVRSTADYRLKVSGRILLDFLKRIDNNS